MYGGCRSLRREVKLLLLKYKVRPRKRLGQNFLVSCHVLRKLIHFLDLQPEDRVLDIGAGLGTATEIIARVAGKVYAVEIDPRLVRALRDRLSTYNNVEIIGADVLGIALPPVDKVFSNVPYSISSKLLIKLLKERRFKYSVLTFQREFAERLLTVPGTPKYGRITVFTRLYGRIEKLIDISRRDFYPPPRVDSIAVRLEPSGSKILDLMPWVEMVTMLIFSNRRRLVRGVLRRRAPELLDRADELGVEGFLNKRVYELTPEEVLALSRAYSVISS